MLHIRNTLFGLAALAVTACGPLDAVTRSGPFETTMPMVTESTAADVTPLDDVVTRAVPDFDTIPAATSYNVVDVRVEVPRSLRVSEANLIYPIADIVWREDPLGDRYEQVETILANAVAQGAEAFNTGQDVILLLEVSRFHSLTQRARYSFGGDHSIKFDFTVLDAATGFALTEPKRIDASFDAYGGEVAIEAEANGLTQKVRITQHVAGVIAQELNGLQAAPAVNIATAQ